MHRAQGLDEVWNVLEHMDRNDDIERTSLDIKRTSSSRAHESDTIPATGDCVRVDRDNV
jgi:hypothetical protein